MESRRARISSLLSLCCTWINGGIATHPCSMTALRAIANHGAMCIFIIQKRITALAASERSKGEPRPPLRQEPMIGIIQWERRRLVRTIGLLQLLPNLCQQIFLLLDAPDQIQFSIACCVEFLAGR